MTPVPLMGAAMPRPGRGGGVIRVLLLLVLVGLGAVASGALIMAGILFLPALIVLGFETARGRPASRATALFGLAASMPSVLALLHDGTGFNAGLALAMDPDAVARAWLAQGSGWLLTELLPFLLVMQAEQNAAAELKVLTTERKALTQEWSHLAAQPPPAAEP